MAISEFPLFLSLLCHLLADFIGLFVDLLVQFFPQEAQYLVLVFQVLLGVDAQLV